MLFSTQMAKSLCQKKDITGAEEEEETQFTTQNSVIQLQLTKLVSLAIWFGIQHVETYITYS